MRTSQSQGGYTLLVVVVVSMVICAGLVLVTSNLSLATYRTTSEQKNNLPAQMAAESGISYAKAKLDAANQLFLNAGIPEKTPKTDLYAAIAALCPTPVSLPLANQNGTRDVPMTRIPNTNIEVRGKQVCEFPENDFITPERAALFDIIVSGSGGNVVTTEAKNTENGVFNTDNSHNIYRALGIENTSDGRKRFFSDVFNYRKQNTISNAVVQSGLRPLVLVEARGGDMAEKEYHLYMKVEKVHSRGQVANSARVLRVNGNEALHRLDIKFDVELIGKQGIPGVPDSFSGYGLFVNDFGVSPSGGGGYYTNTSRFSGRFHTNTNMKLAFVPTRNSHNGKGGLETLTIDGPLSSASCASIYQGPNGDECRRPDGTLWVGDGTGAPYKVTTNDFKPLPGVLYRNGERIKQYGYESKNKSNPFHVFPRIINVVDRGPDTKAPDFNAAFVPLPLNATNQRNMATQGGILLSNPELVQLSIDNVHHIQKIAITIKDRGANKTTTLGYDEQKNMKILVNGQWRDAVKDPSAPVGWREKTSSDSQGITKFNGMLYADGSIKSLTGPERRSRYSKTADGEPAIARFAQLTVTAQDNISLTGDLKTQIPCRKIDACTRKGKDGQFLVKNMLGVYAATGHVFLPYSGNSGQSIVPRDSRYTMLQAPPNVEFDAFIMSARQSITAFNTYNNTYSTTAPSGMSDYGSMHVYGGTVKNKEAVVRLGTKGWIENYLFDGRGLEMSPPGFPTTKKGIAGTADQREEGIFVSSWKGAIHPLNETGQPATDPNNPSKPVPNVFALDNEIIQTRDQ